MKNELLLERIKLHLKVLCEDIGERPTGSVKNRKATNYAKKVLTKCGWKVAETEMQVIDWKTTSATLKCKKQVFDVFASPYSLGIATKGTLVAALNLKELEQLDIFDKILLLQGELAYEQIMPKNFQFYNPDEHKHLISLLEQSPPRAIISATKHPLFVDGDFDIPSVYMPDGDRLRHHVGESVELISKARRIPATAFNLVAGNEDTAKKRIVLSAHIDTAIGTTGALDNATGVAILLTLAELLQDFHGKYSLEFVFFNGEDHYAVPGQLKYLEQNAGKFNDILLNINIDGVGFWDFGTYFSAFDLPKEVDAAFQSVCQDMPNIMPEQPWYQGDHSMFLQNGCPAIAATSQWILDESDWQEVMHTQFDNLDKVAPWKVLECLLGVAELLRRL